MESQEAIGATAGGQHGRDRQARGIRGKNRLWLGEAIELTPQMIFDFQVLDDGLDDDFSYSRGLEVRAERETG